MQSPHEDKIFVSNFPEQTLYLSTQGVRQIAALIMRGKNKFLMDGDNLTDMSPSCQISTSEK